MALERLGKYTILRTLGEGGFGIVYLAEDNIGRQVALKVLHPQIAADEMLAAYFKREAVALARLSHPNIVSINAFDEVEGKSFIEMEYVDGKTISRSLADGRVFALTEVVSIFLQTLSALEHAHDKGVIHRDVKPANIMLATDGQTKIADFGIARVAGSEKLTRTGTGAGSLLYMAPEQIRGKEIDQRSDLYSLGVSLFQVVTGTTPFAGDSDYEIMSKQLNDPPPPLRQLRSDLPAELEAIVLRAMQKRKEDRFQSAAEFAAALRALQETLERSPEAGRTEIRATTTIPGAGKAGPAAKGPERPASGETVIGPIGGRGGGRGWLLWSLIGLVVVAAVVVTVILNPFKSEKPPGEADGEIIPESETETYADSVVMVDRLFTEAEYGDCAGLARELAGSASAAGSETLRFRKLLAASLLLSGDTAAADREIKALLQVDNQLSFPDDVFPARVDARRRFLAAPEPQPAGPGQVSIAVENWDFFKPLWVEFDGNRREYAGEELSMQVETAEKPYELRLTADVDRFTDTVLVGATARSKVVKLSNDRSVLTVIATDVDAPDNLVYAQVYVDGQIRVDEDGTTPIETTCRLELYDGPHKIWIKHEGYRTLDPPKYLNLRGNTKLEFRVRAK